ncbi:MAG: hypothetical protein Q8O55_11220, partial [Dehalococcoidales bacterium]|nr:hypothetical protein [Dehalococcoidales bacterium]
MALIKTPEIYIEKAGLEILLGHGWRPVEVRRIKAKDVRKAKDSIIWCHGKERDEFTPILSETLDLLNVLTPGTLADDSEIFRSTRVRNG